ncbi:M56 family metallopeptidase [Brevundimonas sp. PAMC22021]|uniref:M56 family metallopeptidase n=1 Tax=Brevundimonas sp. PAMC22021 TaxID=2861285 RepID=UPI001C628C7B|nr:M56 family metallopeptidase [Brevundimonas sp. PAMC22021]QYF86978.1 M56 family metallopeptidase [Brevundimonas sp. PAMC22021]
MIAVSPELLIEVAVKGAAATVIALGLVAASKRLPASQRALIAHLGLLVAAAMPLLVLFGPQVEVAGVWTRDAFAAAPSIIVGEPASVGIVQTATTVAPVVDAGRLLLLAWFAGAAFLVSGLGVGLVRLFRLQREAAVLTDRDWLEALALAQHRMGVKQGTALLRSEQLGSPVSWGLLRPTIVLSAGALRTPDRAEAILAHELAHVVRMDWVNLLIARIAAAVFWFNPLVWILARQAHELREEAADDVVLRGDVDGPDYAGMLVDFARGERGEALAAHGVAPGRGSLKRRLSRVLDRGARRDPARPVQVAAGLLAAVALALPLAAFTPMQMRTLAPGAAGSPRSIVMAAPNPASPTVGPQHQPSPAGEKVLDADVQADAAAQGVAPEIKPSLQAAPQAQATASAARLSPEALASMRLHGVTPEWIEALARELPWVRGLSAGQLTTLAIHDVTPEWVRGMRIAGYERLSYSQATSMAVHGVDGAWVRDLASAGLTDLSIDEVVGLRIAGVDARYVRQMEAEGITDADALRRSALMGERPRPPRSSPGILQPSAGTPPTPPVLPPPPPSSR